MEKGRKCDVCNVGVHKESFAKHLMNEKQIEMICTGMLSLWITYWKYT